MTLDQVRVFVAVACDSVLRRKRRRKHRMPHVSVEPGQTEFNRIPINCMVLCFFVRGVTASPQRALGARRGAQNFGH